MIIYGTDVKQAYVVATTPRTGSSFLCDLLEFTYAAGRPIELATPDFREDYFERWKVPHDISHVDFLREGVRRSTGRNRVFGFKILWSQLDWLKTLCSLPETATYREALEHIAPRAKYIYLTREAVYLQAISWYRALKSNRWWEVVDHVNKQKNGHDPEYNSVEIRKLANKLRRQMGFWEAYFKEWNIKPLRITYESVVQDRKEAVGKILTFLDQDPRIAKYLTPARYIQLADNITADWNSRLVAEDQARAR